MRRIYPRHAYEDGPRADCFWAPPPGDFAPLEGDATAEVAVIGAGFVGLNAALELAGRGVDVAVLDEHAPGWGASGRNGGFCCLGGAALDHAGLVRRLGEEAAREFFATQRAAIDWVAEVLERHAIAADRHSDGEMILAHRPRAMKHLRAEAAHMARMGVETRLHARDELAGAGMAGPFHGGLHVRLGFALDPAKYAHGLARAAQAAGARLHGHSAVRAIRPQDGGYQLVTPLGRLRARRLIVATNGYSAEDVPGWLAARYLPMQSNIIVTRPLSPEERSHAGWSSDLMAYDSRNLLHYFRLMPDGRFLFGMRGGLGAGPRAQAAMRRAILRHFHAMFPAWRGVEVPHFWSGFVNMAADGLPHVAPIDGWQDAWVAMAWHGNGVALGSWAGREVARALIGEGRLPAAMARPLPRWPLGRARRLLLAAGLAGLALADRI